MAILDSIGLGGSGCAGELSISSVIPKFNKPHIKVTMSHYLLAFKIMEARCHDLLQDLESLHYQMNFDVLLLANQIIQPLT